MLLYGPYVRMGSLDSSIVAWKVKVQGEVGEKAKYRLDLK